MPETLLVTSSLEQVLKPNAIALGNFDGIHQGHQQVLKSILNLNPSGLTGSKDKIYPTVVTFNPHPKEFFTGEKRQLLTPLAEKIKLLENLGVGQLILLPFDQELASLTPQEFVEKILINRAKACLISVGEDFRFGCQRQGNAGDLQAIASQQKVKVVIAPEKTLKKPTGGYIRISSSHIRKALNQGDLDTAHQMLGRKYRLIGRVVEGQKLGRKIGFPTANLALPPEKFLPRQGVYAVQVYLEGQEEVKLQGVMNIGCRPTLAGNDIAVEVHLLDWSGDLYNQIIAVTLERFLRPEQKFPSLDGLKSQIAADCQQARAAARRY
jgi:riboflavin kinase/FMN adenylyltransferase